jgi:hypothetical protein
MVAQSEPQDPRKPPYSGPKSSSDHIIFVTLHKAFKWLVGFIILLTRVLIIQFHTAACLYIYTYMHSFFDVHPNIFLLLCIMQAMFMLRLLVVAVLLPLSTTFVVLRTSLWYPMPSSK